MGYVRAIGAARLRDRHTGEVAIVDAANFRTEVSGGRSRTHGVERIWVATFDHPEYGTLTWSIAEYPHGELHRSRKRREVGSCEVISDLKFSFVNLETPIETRAASEANIERLVHYGRSLKLSTSDGHLSSVEAWSSALRSESPKVEQALVATAAEELVAIYGTSLAPSIGSSDEAWQRSARALPDKDLLELCEELNVPAQSLEGATFGQNNDGRLAPQSLAIGGHQWTSSGVELLRMLSDGSAALQSKHSSKENMYPTVFARLRELTEDLTQGGLHPSRVYAHINLLKLGLKRANLACSNDEGPPLDRSFEDDVVAVIELGQLLLKTDTIGSSLIEPTSTSQNDADISELLKKLLIALQSIKNLVDPKAIQLLEELAPESNDAAKDGVTPCFAVATINNFLKGFATVASATVCTLITTSIVNSGGGSAAVSMMTGWLDQGMPWLIAQTDLMHLAVASVGPDGSWMSQLLSRPKS